MPDFRKITVEDLIGPLNEVEAKYAPRHLFVAGDVSILEKGGRVSIVGSRNAPKEAMAEAAELARLLARDGHVVVSGLAKGIDTAAHTACIDAGGRTVAVLGTAPDQCYPPENRELQSRIAEKHLCITQFPPGSPTQKKNFVLRNRTMALLSDVTVIIDAGPTSGTQSQAWEAIRLGRALYIARRILERRVPWALKCLNYGAVPFSSTDEDYDALIEDLPKRVPVTDAVRDEFPF